MAPTSKASCAGTGMVGRTVDTVSGNADRVLGLLGNANMELDTVRIALIGFASDECG